MMQPEWVNSDLFQRFGTLTFLECFQLPFKRTASDWIQQNPKVELSIMLVVDARLADRPWWLRRSVILFSVSKLV